MQALSVEGGVVLYFITVIVRVSYDNALGSVQMLYITVVISYLEGDLASVGRYRPFERALFIVTGNYPLYLRYHVILAETIAQRLSGVLVKLGEVTHKGELLFVFIKERYEHRFIGDREKHTGL